MSNLGGLFRLPRHERATKPRKVRQYRAGIYRQAATPSSTAHHHAMSSPRGAPCEMSGGGDLSQLRTIRLEPERNMDKPKLGPNRGNAGKGRPKGKPNKNTALIRDMIAKALDDAGGVKYLSDKAQSHPAAFLALIGRVMPIQVEGAGGGAVQHSLKVTFE